MRNMYLTLAAAASISSSTFAFELTSPAFEDGQPIPQPHTFDGFGCTGDNVSPPLAWTDAPDGTESFALLVHDPDAPTGGAGFWHWVLIDIPASVSELPEGAGASDDSGLPGAGHHVPNDYGIAGWGGPCPPEDHSAHRYNFTLYALPAAELGAPDGATASLTGFLVNANALGSATLQGTYDR